MIKILLVSLLSLNTINAIAASVAIYKDKRGQVLLTTVQPSGKYDKYNKNSKTAYYRNDSSGDTTDKSAQSSIKPIKNNKIATNNSVKSTLAFEVPDGYRLPTKADIVNDWKRFNAPNHLKADFNGDGIIDEAYILPKKGSKLGYGVFVAINKKQAGIQSGRKFQMFKLTADDDMRPQSFAIELAEPSNKVWETACGKGYWDCEIGEPAEVKITKPSIMFCYIESACTMYMWDSDKLSFKEIRFSD